MALVEHGFVESSEDGASLSQRISILNAPRVWVGDYNIHLDPVVGGSHDGECLARVILFNMTEGIKICEEYGPRDKLLKEFVDAESSTYGC